MPLTLRVNEIFYSLQGEGARQGEPSVFVRLSGCDLTCGFCDTEFESGQVMTLERISAKVSLFKCKWIVWTGGEPALQLDDEAVAYFKERGFLQAIETNGNHKLAKGLDWVACSPKVAEHVLAQNFPDGVDELRYVRHKGHQSVPNPSIKARTYFISPQFSGNRPDIENIQHCISLCLEHPQWRLSIQLHKILNIL